MMDIVLFTIILHKGVHALNSMSNQIWNTLHGEVHAVDLVFDTKYFFLSEYIVDF